VRKHAVEAAIPGLSRGPITERCTVLTMTEQANAGKGRAPGRPKPRRVGTKTGRRDAESTSQRDGGKKPLKRGRTGPQARNAATITSCRR
jgi:hypothetical protein